jgi:uncharacterized protein YPO0396
MEQADHDALIRLEAKFEAFIVTSSANNIASVERDTRIETAVKAINGTVRKHDAWISTADSDAIGISAQREQHEEMWSAYKIGRWVGITVGTAAIVQSAGIVTLLIMQSS